MLSAIMPAHTWVVAMKPYLAIIVGLSLIVLSITFFAVSGIYNPWHKYEEAFAPVEVKKGDWFGSSLDMFEGEAAITAFYSDHYGINAGAGYSANVDETSISVESLDITGLQDGDELGFSTSMSEDIIAIGAIGGFALPPGPRTNGRVYIFQKDDSQGKWIQKSVILSPSNLNGDYFGYSVDVQGQVLIVGSKHNDDAGDNAGAAYVFSLRDIHNPVEIAKLIPDPANIPGNISPAGSEFGTHVAINENVIAVGAPMQNSGKQNSGVVWVYRQKSGNWLLDQIIESPNPGTNDYFGVGVAIAGKDIVVGSSHWADDGRKGRAELFSHDSGQWKFISELAPEQLNNGDMLGFRVAMSSSLIAISAHLSDDQLKKDIGSVHLFRKRGANWTYSNTVTPNDGKYGDQFGIALSVYHNQLLVGSEKADVNGKDSGAVYFYENP